MTMGKTCKLPAQLKDKPVLQNRKMGIGTEHRLLVKY